MKRNLLNNLIFISAFFSINLFSTELKPWYPAIIQIQGHLDYRFQTYKSLDAPKKNRDYSSDDSFLDGSLLVAFDPISVEVEAQLADTRKRNFDWDHIGITVRYLIMDDNIGDPFSITTGLTLSRAWREALNDISSFHHGQNEAFLHLAIGRQKICNSDWISRYWALFGIGTADRWTPWVVTNFNYERKCDANIYRLFINSLWGCGNHKLRVEDFGGYSKIDHKSVDIGCGYTRQFDYNGTLSFDYFYRVYAHNYPNRASNFMITYKCPLGSKADYYLVNAYTKLFGKPF